MQIAYKIWATLPSKFLSIQIDRKIFRIEVNDGRILFNTDYTTCRYETNQYVTVETAQAV